MSNEVKIIAGIGIITLVLVVGAAMLFGGAESATPVSSGTPIKNMSALVHPDSHEINAHSKVTLVEFGDFQCPACGAEYPIVTQILQNYKGKINYVFRNFPLPQHQNSHVAAEAAEAAGAQGNFFGMYNLLYSNQNTWSDATNPTSYFDQYAQALHLNMKEFNSNLKANKFASKIQKDINDGFAVGVDATPTFFLNGVEIQGGLPYSDFSAQIDAAIKKAS